MFVSCISSTSANNNSMSVVKSCRPKLGQTIQQPAFRGKKGFIKGSVAGIVFSSITNIFAYAANIVIPAIITGMIILSSAMVGHINEENENNNNQLT